MIVLILTIILSFIISLYELYNKSKGKNSLLDRIPNIITVIGLTSALILLIFFAPGTLKLINKTPEEFNIEIKKLMK